MEQSFPKSLFEGVDDGGYFLCLTEGEIEVNDGWEGVGVVGDDVEYFVGADGAVAF